VKKPPQVANTLVFSYIAHRRAIGTLGVGLPILLYLGALIIFQTHLQESISDYYYTGMRNVFVGVMWAIGIFLISYKGYDIWDTTTSVLAGLFAMAITIFPTTPKLNPTPTQLTIGYIHLAFGGLLFSMLIIFCLVLFTRVQPNPKKRPTKRKLQRNVIYRICGIVMTVCIVLSGVFVIFIRGHGSPLDNLDPIFWLETISIECFGISWLVKGETILKDLG
jgi:hypothetical protein